MASSNTRMNSLPMILRFSSGSVTPRSFDRKPFRGVDVFQFDVEIFAENPLHDFFFARAQQTVIYENARELIAYGFMQKGGCH